MNTLPENALDQLIERMIDIGVEKLHPREVNEERGGILDNAVGKIVAITGTEELGVRRKIQTIVAREVVAVCLELGARQALVGLLHDQRSNKSLAIRETLQTFADQVGKE